MSRLRHECINQIDAFSPKALTGDTILGACVSGILAIFAVSRFSPPFMNADTVLFPIMSLQHVTFFYWGQNRYVNVIPFILSWIRDPDANLLAHLFLFSFSFFGLLCAIGLSGTALLFPGASRSDRWTATAMLIAVVLGFLQFSPSFVFAAEGQPYAMSYLLLVMAALLATRPIGLARALSSVACLTIASAINPPILLPALVLSLFYLAFGRRFGAAILAAVPILAAAIWSLLAQSAPMAAVPYFGIDLNLNNLGEAMAVSAGNMERAMRLPVVVVACAVLAGFAAVRLPKASSPLLLVAIYAVIICALASWMGFSASGWVKAGNYLIRYFFVVVLAVPMLIVLQLFAYLLPTPRLVRSICAAASVAFIAFYLIRPPVPVDSYSVFQPAAPYARYAADHKIQFVAGDYWLAWPVVFLLLSHNASAYGLAGRADGNIVKERDAVRLEIQRTNTARALCVGNDQAACLKAVQYYTGMTWRLTTEPCPGVCSVIETKPSIGLN